MDNAMDNTDDTLMGYEVRDVLTGRLVAEIVPSVTKGHWDLWITGGTPALRGVDTDTVRAFIADQPLWDEAW